VVRLATVKNTQTFSEWINPMISLMKPNQRGKKSFKSHEPVRFAWNVGNYTKELPKSHEIPDSF